MELRTAAVQLTLFDDLTSKPAEPLPECRPGRDRTLEQLARQLAIDVGCPDLASILHVTWNARLRSTAGRAFHGRPGRGWEAPWRVELNPLLAQFGPEEIDKTLRHELAHLIAHRKAARRRIEAHGPEWRAACAALGIPDERATHHLPLPRRQVRKPYVYSCTSCGLEVMRVRPFRRPSACGECCGTHSRGRFDARFLLRKTLRPTDSAS